ncbi:MAG TPA: prolyl oligopeptidase family serine peptidase [Tepidisphaeraceae bacterium]|nr:prolyl oligopeptidase family serine peptidase [Tepidisphaeraceae bacterium]
MASADDEYDVIPEAPPPIPKRRQPVAPQPVQPVQPAYGYQRPTGQYGAGQYGAGQYGAPAAYPPRGSSGSGNAKWWMIGLGVFGLIVVFGLVTIVVRATRRAKAPAAPVALRVDRSSFPAPPSMESLEDEDGVQFGRIQLAGRGPGQAMEMWLYLPPGKHAPKSLPCVFVAPAGTNLMTGMKLGDSDQPEHVPYVKAGFAVLAYEIDGEPEHDGDSEMKRASRQFVMAEGGLANAKTAIEYVLAKVPEVDPNRLYCAGHSSAATLALQLASSDGRMKGCVAYAPATNVVEWMSEQALDQWDGVAPGIGEFIRKYSPDKMPPPKCPVFLFHATEDENVSVEQSRAYKKLHPSQVKLITLKGGDHYDSMLFKGMPAAIKWLKELPSEKNAAAAPSTGAEQPTGEGTEAPADGAAPDDAE